MHHATFYTYNALVNRTALQHLNANEMLFNLDFVKLFQLVYNVRKCERVHCGL